MFKDMTLEEADEILLKHEQYLKNNQTKGN